MSGTSQPRGAAAARVHSIAGPPPRELQVRIGELAVTDELGARLVTVGLGSCVGVALFDVQGGVAGLAHVFLPEPPASGAAASAGPGTYATVAVPALVQQVGELGGARASRLVAVLAGGARMFASSTGADVGARNIAAVHEMLHARGVRIVGEITGGSSGRTMRVERDLEGHARVLVREVGSEELEVWRSQARPASRFGQVAA